MSGYQIGIGLGLTRLKGGGVVDPIAYAAITSKLIAGVSDLNLLVLTDSTGNDVAEWVRLLDPYWSAKNPNYMVRNALYDDTTGLYGPGTLGNNLKLTNIEPGASQFEETFNRADGSVGTTSSGGQTIPSNTWTISSNRGVQASTTNYYQSSNPTGDKRVIRVSHVWGTAGTAAFRVYCEYTAVNDALFVAVGDSGVASLYYAAFNVLLDNTATGGNMVDGETVDIQIVVDGVWVYAEVTRNGATYPLGGILTGVQRAALTDHRVMLSGLNDLTAMYWDNLLINDLPPRRLTVWNAAHPGASIAYHDAELAITTDPSVIGTVDLCIVSLSHNQNVLSPEDYETALIDLVADVRALQTDVPVMMISQNPRAVSDTYADEHAARMTALRGICQRNGWGFADTFTGYDLAWVNVDGVHPDAPGPAYQAGKIAAAFGL